MSIKVVQGTKSDMMNNQMSNTNIMDAEMASASKDFFNAINKNEKNVIKIVDEVKKDVKKEEVKEVKNEVKKEEEGGLSGSMISLIIFLVITFILSSIGASLYFSGGVPTKVK